MQSFVQQLADRGGGAGWLGEQTCLTVDEDRHRDVR